MPNLSEREQIPTQKEALFTSAPLPEFFGAR